jgi:hypothetical protein
MSLPSTAEAASSSKNNRHIPAFKCGSAIQNTPPLSGCTAKEFPVGFYSNFLILFLMYGRENFRNPRVRACVQGGGKFSLRRSLV